MGALVACAALLVACSDDPKSVLQPTEETPAAVMGYDATLEPSAAVLSLVPADATTLMVTDFDQARLVLGYGSLTGRAKPEERARFWRELPRTAAMSKGMLRGVDARLRVRFGFGADDVAWEASYSGPEDGWVLAFHDDVPMQSVQRAVRAGLGPLAGAVVDTTRRLVTSAEPPPVEQSWAAVTEVSGLVGREAVSTWVQRGCLDFDTVFGEGMEDQLASAPADALESLDPLEAFAVALGSELGTVQLGPDRSDAFDRMRLAEVMPPTDPEFGLVMDRGVADPSTGRLGFTLVDPAAAARLTRGQHLPFAVCAR